MPKQNSKIPRVATETQGSQINKKEWNCAICNHPDGPQGYYVNWVSQTEMDRHHLISLHMSSKNKTNEQTEQNKTKLIDTENRLVVTKGKRLEGWIDWVMDSN